MLNRCRRNSFIAYCDLRFGAKSVEIGGLAMAIVRAAEGRGRGGSPPGTVNALLDTCGSAAEKGHRPASFSSAAVTVCHRICMPQWQAMTESQRISLEAMAKLFVGKPKK